MLGTKMVFQEDLNELSDYFYAAPVGLHLTGPDGTIRRTNLAELELLGYGGLEEEYVGRHLAEFHADSDRVRTLLDKLAAGQPVAEHDTTLLRRDGTQQRVLLYANARINNGEFCGVRCCTFPHPEDLRPDIAEVGALKDESIEARGLELTPEERNDLHSELQDFFDNGPVSLHIVGGDGLIKRANKSELASMGYNRESYIGQHIARFHADKAVIDGMLEDLVGGSPLVNFSATLFQKDGSRLPVMIYSNSRMREGSFLNTRCFTVPVPKSRPAIAAAINFAWPRNEDFGFSIAGKEEPLTQAKPNPMTLALKYVASRKRPEESLGLLAQISQTLGTTQPFTTMLREAVSLTVPYLADFTLVAVGNSKAAYACSPSLRAHEERFVNYFNGASSNPALVRDTLRKIGRFESCVDLAAKTDSVDGHAAALLDLGIRSLMILPLTIRGRQTGTLTLLRESVPSRREFGPADRALAEELARRLSFAVEINELRSPA